MLKSHNLKYYASVKPFENGKNFMIEHLWIRNYPVYKSATEKQTKRNFLL